MLPVNIVKIHHEGGGSPHDDPGHAGTMGYGAWIGPNRFTLLRTPDGSPSPDVTFPGERDFATYNLNGVTWSCCLSGQRQDGIAGDPAHPVTDTEVALIGQACDAARARGWIIPTPVISPHDSLAGSATQCPGTQTYDRWGAIVAAADAVHDPNHRPSPEVIRMYAAFAVTPTGNGYYLVKNDGSVFTFGDAKYEGGANNLKLAKPVCAIAVHPSNAGYWLAAEDGGVFAYGAARPYGNATGLQLAAPVCDIIAHPNGDGYWLLGADGGVFAYGAVHDYGNGIAK